MADQELSEARPGASPDGRGLKRPRGVTVVEEPRGPPANRGQPPININMCVVVANPALSRASAVLEANAAANRALVNLAHLSRIARASQEGWAQPRPSYEAEQAQSWRGATTLRPLGAPPLHYPFGRPLFRWVELMSRARKKNAAPTRRSRFGGAAPTLPCVS